MPQQRVPTGPFKCHVCGQENSTLHCAQCGEYFCDQDWNFWHKGQKRKTHVQTPLAPLSTSPSSLPPQSTNLDSTGHLTSMDTSDNVQLVTVPPVTHIPPSRSQQSPPPKQVFIIPPPPPSSSYTVTSAPTAKTITTTNSTVNVTLSSKTSNSKATLPPPPGPPTSHLPTSISLPQISASNSKAASPPALPMCKVCGSQCTDRYCKNCSNSFCEDCFTKFHKPTHRSKHNFQLFAQLSAGNNLFEQSSIFFSTIYINIIMHFNSIFICALTMCII